MNPLARIRPRSFLAFGMIATFSLGGAEQKAPLTAAQAPDQLTSNASVNYLQVFTHSQEFQQREAKAKANPSMNYARTHRRGHWVGYNGQRYSKEDRSVVEDFLSLVRQVEISLWDGKSFQIRRDTWRNGIKTISDYKTNASLDYTIRPAEWWYLVRGRDPLLLVEEGRGKKFDDGEMVRIEFNDTGSPFTIWINPKRSNLIERAVYPQPESHIEWRYVIREAIEVDGVWVPTSYIKETWDTSSKDSVPFIKETYYFRDWKFGKATASDIEFSPKQTTPKTP